MNNNSDKRYRLTPINLENPLTAHDYLILLTGKNKDVLELGTGSGYLTKILKENGCSITGIESVPELAKQASKFTDKIIIGDIETLDLKKELSTSKFDVILIGDFLEYLYDPEKISKLLINHLKPDGYFVMSIPNVGHGSIRLKLLDGNFEYKQTGLLDVTPKNFFTFDTILHLLNNTGLKINKLHRVIVDFFGGPNGTDLDKSMVPSELLLSLSRDPESSTFQYVFTASPNPISNNLDFISQFPKNYTINDLNNRLNNLHSQIRFIQKFKSREHELLYTISEKKLEISMLQNTVENFEKTMTEIHQSIGGESDSNKPKKYTKPGKQEIIKELKINSKNTQEIQKSNKEKDVKLAYLTKQESVLLKSIKIQYGEILHLGKNISTLHALKYEKEVELINSQKSNNKKEIELINLQNAVGNYQNMITDIHQSFVFRMLHKYDNSVGKIIHLKPKKYTKSVKQESTIEELKINSKKTLELTLEKKDIICFPIINWDFRFQRPQHILTEFAKKGHRVFYFTVNLRQLEKSFEIKNISKNIFQIELSSTKFFDIYKDKFDKSLIQNLIDKFKEVQKILKLDAVSFVEFPTWSPLVLELRKQLDIPIIFDCLDDFTGFGNVTNERKKEEISLMSSSDLVLTTSSYLLNKVSKQTSKILFLPNAGEFEHFNKMEKGFLKYKKPIIGYFGSISDWFDTDLIEHLAKNRPEFTFLMIGHTFGADIRKFKKLPNVHFIGERPYSELPKYLYDFDACLIPFKMIPLIEATHPVKIYEYFAAGKPVIATNMPELHSMSDMCYLAENKEDFLKKLDLAVNENDDTIVQKRMKFASENTWEDRFKTLYTELKKIDSFNIEHHS